MRSQFGLEKPPIITLAIIQMSPNRVYRIWEAKKQNTDRVRKYRNDLFLFVVCDLQEILMFRPIKVFALFTCMLELIHLKSSPRL